MIRSLMFRQLFMFADIVLACMVAFAAFSVFQKVMNNGSPDDGVSEALPMSPGDSIAFATVGPREQYNPIITSGIFGSAAGRSGNDKPEPVEKPKVTAPVETELPLVLRGEVLAGVNDTKATAMIEVVNRGQSAKAYYVGSQVVENVYLLEVRSREVLLDNRRTGKKEVLKRDEESEFTQVAQAAPPPVSARGARNQNSNVLTLERTEFSQKLMDSYEDIATKIDIKEYKDASGKVKGLTSPNLTNVALAKELGLQNDDVLTSINNEPIDSIDKVYDIVQKYRNAVTFRLGIIRNNRPQFIIYRLN